jgi:hypothetical protein
MKAFLTFTTALVTALAAGACDREPDAARRMAVHGTAPDADVVSRAAVERALDESLARLAALTDSLDALLRPVPLLTPAQEAEFRRYGNAQHLQRARALGVRPADEAQKLAALRDGRLVELEDSTWHWVVRELEFSEPLVVPAAHALLMEIGERFHARLDAMGLPPLRLEVTSVMRTPASQAALRLVNPNAALGESTHEYGTTIDVAYASFAAPATTPIEIHLEPEVAWLAPRLEHMAAALLETLAARNSRELQAILGHVMAELQREGAAMVTMERLQPVYHFTVARPLPPT